MAQHSQKKTEKERKKKKQLNADSEEHVMRERVEINYMTQNQTLTL